MSCRGWLERRRVHSVLTNVSVSVSAAGVCLSWWCFGRVKYSVFDGCRSDTFIGTVALLPAPTMRPITTRLLVGTLFIDLMLYAKEANVATVSFVMAAILSLGSEKCFLRFFVRSVSSSWESSWWVVLEARNSSHGFVSSCSSWWKRGGDCGRMWHSYPSNSAWRRFRSELSAKPLPVGNRTASSSDFCLQPLAHQSLLP